jgi:hypothetical protein
VTVRLERHYGSAELAQRVVGAIAADDPTTHTLHRRGDLVIIEVEGNNPATVRATLDDLIACVGVAERTAGIVKKIVG